MAGPGGAATDNGMDNGSDTAADSATQNAAAAVRERKIMGAIRKVGASSAAPGTFGVRAAIGVTNRFGHAGRLHCADRLSA